VEWSEELSSGLLQAAPDAILVMDGKRIVLVNDQAEAMFGWPRAELLDQPAQMLLTDASVLAYPEQLTRRINHPEAGPMGTLSLTAKRKDGSEFPVEASLAAVDTGSGRVIVAVIRDLTERDRLRVEAQTHRNQRLEGLGQLAGGVAHDFNNMLGVIVNYANFVIEEAESESPDLAAIAADARQVIRAGERGTELTHQLLAFARREVVRPEVLDLNTVVADVENLLRRSIGSHITLITRPAPALPPVTCDPGQIEQLLVSLAVNARDAMPAGGNLVIDTAAVWLGDAEVPDVPAGEYVRLRMRDGGRGMTPEVAERAFEPFFTTKPSGEGTGLGLATVYGIVTQAGGYVTLESSPGLGTTVTVLLPAGADLPSPSPAPAAELPRGASGETLLVVEDEDALRDVAGRILSAAGYHVLTADGGLQALELAAIHDGTIDLLLSDVVMPGMLGKELAERLRDTRPGTRVLFMSGYAQPVLASQGTLDPGVALLEKPFTAADLLTAVRRRLDD
jgi:two-component system, cell cycle sensor histidine kinase and response regulator CckA